MNEENNLTTQFDKYYSSFSQGMFSASKKFFVGTLVLKNIEILTGPNLASELIKSKEFRKMSMEKKMEYIQVMLNATCDDLWIPHMELHVRQRSLWKKLVDRGIGEENFGACVIYDSVKLKTIVEAVAHEAYHQYIKLAHQGKVPLCDKNDAGALHTMPDNQKNNSKTYMNDYEEYGARWFGVKFAEKYDQPTNRKRWNFLEKKYYPNIKEQYLISCEQMVASGKYEILDQSIKVSNEFKL